MPRRDTWVSRRGHGRFRVGWLRGDLIAFARAMADYLATPLGETVVRTLAATQDDPALELLAAPPHFRALLTRQPIDDSFIEHVVDTLLRGL